MDRHREGIGHKFLLTSLHKVASAQTIQSQGSPIGGARKNVAFHTEWLVVNLVDCPSTVLFFLTCSLSYFIGKWNWNYVPHRAIMKDKFVTFKGTCNLKCEDTGAGPICYSGAGV